MISQGQTNDVIDNRVDHLMFDKGVLVTPETVHDQLKSWNDAFQNSKNAIDLSLARATEMPSPKSATTIYK